MAGESSSDTTPTNSSSTEKQQSSIHCSSAIDNESNREQYLEVQSINNHVSSTNNIPQPVNYPVKIKKQIFRKGTGFTDYEELVKAIQEYQTLNHVKLYKRDSRSVESMISRGRAPKKRISMDLKYGELSFRCKHGGKIYKSFSKGLRPHQRLLSSSLCILSLYSFL